MGKNNKFEKFRNRFIINTNGHERSSMGARQYLKDCAEKKMNLVDALNAIEHPKNKKTAEELIFNDDELYALLNQN